MGHCQHLLTESAWFKKVTYSLHRHTWPSSTGGRDKQALKWSTHAAKSLGKNTEYRKFILMNIPRTDIACVLAFHKKRNINFFCLLFKQKGKEWPATTASLTGGRVTSSCQPVNTNASLQSYGSKASNYSTQASFSFYWGSVQSYSFSSTVSILTSAAIFKMHCIVTNLPSGLLVESV